MNIKSISAVVSSIVLLSVAGAAMAEQPYPPETKFVSTKTRAEVVAEMVQARARGEMPLNEYYAGFSVTPVAFKSTKTRAQVREELKEYRQAHADTGVIDSSYVR